MHKLQRQILLKLTFSQGLPHKELKPSPDIENNQLNFHLKQLQKEGLIKKHQDKYSLTEEGKKFITGLESETVDLPEQAKIFAVCVCFKKIGKEDNILFYTRKKHPQYGFQGFPAGKIKLGESPAEAADRELKEETQLVSKSKLTGIVREHVYKDGTNGLLVDRYMFICKFEEPDGELTSGKEGDYHWLPKSEIETKITKPFTPLSDVLDIIKLSKSGGGLFFKDSKVVSDDF